MDILQRDGVIEWRVIGGTLDFYFVSGPTPIKAIEQYSEIAGKPQQMPDWAFGFQLCRWGYTSIAETRGVVEKMREANIPLEVGRPMAVASDCPEVATNSALCRSFR